MNFGDIKAQKKVHFIGIGGIGMSALAFILRKFNVPVQGSDLAENYLTPKLREVGVDYFLGHEAKNISDEVSLIVQTSIIKTENPEIIEAQKRNIPVITRADLLAILMQGYKGITIAGTHGKTSTTGMVSLVLEFGDLDPTVVNGGVIHYFGSNSKVGHGKYLVAESDESDASFIKLPSFIGAVVNIEPEHLDFAGYGGDFSKQQQCFEQYVKQIPQEGLCVLCVDSPEVVRIYDKLKSSQKNLFTYSIEGKNADLMAENVKLSSEGVKFDVKFSNGKTISDIKIKAFGRHNASNALAAIAIGNFLGISDEKIKEGLINFTGVKRRFTKVGEYQDVTIIDDYGHHPTEIKATLHAARSVVGKHKLISVLEPHKYSRVRDEFDGFCHAFDEADIVLVADIYAAAQPIIEGISQDSLIEGIKKAGHKNVIKVPMTENVALEIAKILKDKISTGDMVLCTGAGKVTYWASDLEKSLDIVNKS